MRHSSITAAAAGLFALAVRSSSSRTKLTTKTSPSPVIYKYTLQSSLSLFSVEDEGKPFNKLANLDYLSYRHILLVWGKEGYKDFCLVIRTSLFIWINISHYRNCSQPDTYLGFEFEIIVYDCEQLTKLRSSLLHPITTSAAIIP